MINLESRLMPVIAEVLNFVKQQASNDVKTYHSSGELGKNITQEDIERVCLVLENSISSNFMRASNQITSTLSEIQKKLENAGKKTRSRLKK